MRTLRIIMMALAALTLFGTLFQPYEKIPLSWKTRWIDRKLGEPFVRLYLMVVSIIFGCLGYSLSTG